MGKILLLFFILFGNFVKGAKHFNFKSFDSVNYDSSVSKGEATNDYIKFYQNYISDIRGHECPMYPSCSNFGIKTFTDKGFFSAMALTSDRLMRCGHDHNLYSLTLRNSGFKFIDYPYYQFPGKDLFYSKNNYYFAYFDNNVVDSNSLFIQNLINNQYFKEALLEILKLEFKNKNISLEVFINKIICLKSLQEYEKAIFEFDNNCPAEYKNNSELLYQLAIIQYKLLNFSESKKFCDLALKNDILQINKLKILDLVALNFINLDDYENAKLTLELLKSNELNKNLAESKIQLIEKSIKKKDKNSVLAGSLSIIPGLGYAYTGHTQTAITAFLLNSLIGYATYSNFKNHNYGMGILTGVFNLSFYFGNIYGASKSAKRYNEQKKLTLINKLEYNYNF